MTLESISRAGAPAEAALENPRLHPSVALAPFVEALVVGRRVAVLGDATLGLAEALHARGARLVHAYDPDAARVAEALARRAPSFGSPAAGRPAGRGVAYALLGEDLGVRDGAFDAVLVPDLSIFADRADAVRRARKLVAPTGAVVVAAPNPEAKRRLVAASAPPGEPLGYYEIFDLLTLQFPVVRMVGQAPFVGYAIVDFAPDREPDVSFDASLMAGTEEPEMFVAIASERPVATDAYLVVEVPAASVLAGAERGAPRAVSSVPPSAADVRRSPDDHVRLAEMQARLVLMEAELDDLRGQKGDLVRQLDAARTVAEQAEARARETAEEAEVRAREASRAEGAQAARWRDLEARAGDEHVRAERLTHKVRDLEEELVRQRDRSQKLTKQLDDEKRARQKAEIELGMTRGLPTKESADLDAQRLAEATETLRRAKAHADSLASELLAKSKETAELRREHEATQEKLAAAEQSLRAAQARIDDMEEEAQTLRRPTAVVREPVVVAGEVQSGMVARITRLEAEAAEAKRAADELRRELDEARAALGEARRAADEARRAEEQARREADEARRAEEQARREADEARREADGLRREVAALTPSVAEAQRHASESRRAADEARRTVEALEAQRDAARRSVEALEAQRDAAAGRAEKLQVELDAERAARKELAIAKAAIEARAVGIEQRLAEREAEVEAAPEVSQLEAALRDRGHRIAALERDLRESERIGRELIAEIEILRERAGGEGEGGSSAGGGASRQGGAPRTSSGAIAAPQAAAPQVPGAVDALTEGAFQHRIDALSAEAARKQAELLTSTWKIQALERELAEARAAAADPSLVQRELSSALSRAQSEIADLRRVLQQSGVAHAVVESSVLLHQQLAR
jgi:hypothetical protein